MTISRQNRGRLFFFSKPALVSHLLWNDQSIMRLSFVLSLNAAPLAGDMSRPMTRCAQRDEILFGVVSQLAARTDVVDLKIVSCSAVLAAPSVALKHMVTQSTIRFRLKPKPRPLSVESLQRCFPPFRVVDTFVPR